MRKYIKADYEATIPQDMLYAPDGNPNMIRDYFRQRGAEDKRAKEEAAERAKIQPMIDALKAKYPEQDITAIRESAESSQLDELFELTVPGSGMCDSVGGEIVRAMMRILYRDWNDGDVFYEGYGKETCMSSVEYLCSVIPWAYDDFSDIAERELQGGAYTQAISHISEEICWELLHDKLELFWTPNEVDSRNFVSSEYEFYEPEYDYTGDFPYELTQAIQQGKVDIDDLQWSIESDIQSNNIQYSSLSIDNYGFYVEGLDRDSLNELENIERNKTFGEYYAEEYDVYDSWDEDDDEEDW